IHPPAETHMRRSLVHLTSLALLFGASVAGPVERATGQELALVERAPRFLVPGPTHGSPPVEVEAARLPTLRRKLSLDFDNVRLSDALDAIARQTGVRFVYVQSVLPADSLVRFSSKNITVAAALTELLLDAGVDVLVSGTSQIAIVRRVSA